MCVWTLICPAWNVVVGTLLGVNLNIDVEFGAAIAMPAMASAPATPNARMTAERFLIRIYLASFSCAITHDGATLHVRASVDTDYWV